MTISSRTPEGFPSHCPLCGASCNLEFSDPGKDATCPDCGHLVWYSSQVLEWIRHRCGETLGIPRDEITADTSLEELGSGYGADSLDVVELVMWLEEEFDMDIQPGDFDNQPNGQDIRTVGDLIRRLEQRRGLP